MGALGIFYLAQAVLARLAVADKHRQQQAGQHAGSRDGHGVHHVHIRHVHAGFFDIAQQNLLQENFAKAHRKQHIGRGQAKGNHAGHQAAVQLQARHHVQQRWHQQGDKGNVDGHQVLAHHAHHREQADHQPLQPLLAAVVLQLAHGGVGQGVRQAGFGNGHGKGPQQGVRQRDGRTAGNTFVECGQCLRQVQPAQQAAHQRGDDQADHNMGTRQRQGQHQGNSDRDGKHLYIQTCCFVRKKGRQPTPSQAGCPAMLPAP